MKLDAIDRRIRTESQPHRSGKQYVEITPRVVRALNALRRHPLLPTPIWYRFWRDEGGRLDRFQKIAKKLFHEHSTVKTFEVAGPFVSRPPALNPKGPNPQPAWYALTPAGLAIAQSVAKWELPNRRDPDHHRAMGSCIGASLELLASEHGFEFVHLEDILADDEKCPATTAHSRSPLKMQLKAGVLEPDDVFGLKNADDKKRYYLREDDRGTESYFRADKLQTSLATKLDRYDELMTSRVFQDHFGVPFPRILFVMTSKERVEMMLKHVKARSCANRLYVLSLPNFARGDWDAPREPIQALFGEWQTVNGPRRIFDD